jgi:hypothetical protein
MLNILLVIGAIVLVGLIVLGVAGALFYILKYIGLGIFYILFGPALGISFLVNKLLGVFHVRPITVLALLASPYFLSRIYAHYPTLQPIANIGFAVLAFMCLLNVIVHRVALSRQKHSIPLDYYKAKTASYYRYVYASALLVAEGIGAFYAFKYGETDTEVIEAGFAINLLFMLFSFIMFIYSLVKESKYAHQLKSIYDTINTETKLDATLKYGVLPDDSEKTVDMTQEREYVMGVATKLISEKKIVDISLLDELWFMNKKYYETKLADIEDKLSQKTANDVATVLEMVKGAFNPNDKIYQKLAENDIPRLFINSWGAFPDEYVQDFAERYLDFGEYHYFDDEKKFVTYDNQSKILVCASCGNTRLANKGDSVEGTWYCSDICKETDEVCLDIKEKPYDEFISDASGSGIVIMDSANSWDLNNPAIQGNYKKGFTGYGKAAEHYNDMVDAAEGKKVAPYSGADNAPSGADRIVNGQGIQTKYCQTAGKSVGAVFRGQDNTYDYFNTDGSPMPVEVPKDQYPAALKIMERNIKAGKVPNIDKVPGANEAEKAKNLVVKGHATYDQSKALCKFGTMESLEFDVRDGSVVALKAGGVSFAITATMAYINTKDPKQALRVAVVSGGKTAAKSLVVFVGTQQLHRLEAVQTLVSKIDVEELPQCMSNFIKKGYGVTTKGAANRVLSGTVVSSIIVIAVTTGPDLIRMIRGRMSGAQFVKNLAVAASGVTGGVVGGIVGGAALAWAGPVGMFIGRTAGSVVGGIVASKITNKIAKKLLEEDRDKMLRIVKAQVEYLARLFMLTAAELDNLNKNLESVITNDSLERMFASDNQKAFSNFLVKPIAVSIVKQRPVFQYREEDVIDACAEAVA